jgi:hypothetical protein
MYQNQQLLLRTNYIFQVGNHLVFIDFFTRDKFDWKYKFLFNPFFFMNCKLNLLLSIKM